MIERLTKDSRDALLALRRGENVFGLPEEIAAGLVDTGGPSAVDLQNRNDLTVRMGRFFPAPAIRLPSGR
jgi:hypothetical protein